MFGHGQIEGFTEKYGMEYKRARYDEFPNEDLVARHQREIAPLLKNRHLFAESGNFVLFDFWTDGSVDENVFAYSNRLGKERAIVLFNNRYGETRGTIHLSAAAMDKAHGVLHQRRLTDALGLPSDHSIILAFEDTSTGLKYLHRSNAIDHHGLHVELRAYQYVVFQHWMELRPTAEQPWDKLCDELRGKAVYNLDEAVAMTRWKPVHAALRQLIHPSLLEPLINAAERCTITQKTDAATRDAEAQRVKPSVNIRLTLTSEKAGVLFERIREMEEAAVLLESSEELFHERFRNTVCSLEGLPALETVLVQGWPIEARMMLPSNSPVTSAIKVWAPVLTWALLSSISSNEKHALLLFDQLKLRPALAEIFSSLGLVGEDAWRAVARVRILLSLNAGEFLVHNNAFWDDSDVKWLLGVNEAGGKIYFNKENFEQLSWWLQLPNLIIITAKGETGHNAAIEIEDHIRTAFDAAQEAGYEISKFMDLLNTDRKELQWKEDIEPTDEEGELPLNKVKPADSNAISGS